MLRNGTLTISLAKKTVEPWGQLCFEGSKDEIKQRRREALKDRNYRVQNQMEKVASRKVEEERLVLRKVMELEEKERRRIDEIKATEKKHAEDAMYDTFSRMQRYDKSNEKQLPTKDVQFKLESDSFVAPTKETEGNNSIRSSQEPPQDCCNEEEEDNLPESSEIPPPRKAVQTTFRHTPRLFKTPSRESTIKQEQEFIMKNRSNLKKNVLLNDVDIGDADPVWLNAKGDEFCGKGDFCSAINAYSEALAADETMVETLGKRAACYLHLREGSCCIKDCLATLEMSDAIESQFDAIAEKAQFLKKTHMRLALAYCLNEEYTNGMKHFATAHQLDENDKVATECINYLETLMEAMEWKAKADDSFAEGDLVKAKEFYTKSLLVDPELIKALMNRAACQLAMEDAAGSIDDCSLALDLISCGKPKQQSSCPIASVLFPKPSERRKWVVTLLCRRAAARRLAKDLDGALADLEEARTTVRCNDDIEAVEKSIACLKKEMA